MSASLSNSTILAAAETIPLRTESPDSAIVISPATSDRGMANIPNAPPQSPIAVAQPQQPNLPAVRVDDNRNHLLAQHRVAETSWGNGNGGWGDRVDDAWATVIQSPKIVSLTPGRSSWTDPGEAVFQWRAKGVSDMTSHRHIVFYVRSDLHTVFDPVSNRKTSPLAQQDTDVWARTQIIRCLPEAQHACVPGPDFTLDELATHVEVVESSISNSKYAITGNLARIEAIKDEQEPLRARLRALDAERSQLTKRNEELEVDLKDYAEVQADLRDLEALAMVFLPSSA
ncbi:hypothetical protein AAF712_016050 [Marasmius tenuissimus]|uniref:Uncharacterized protein n=1 Tax=Marasmius tenuissimus TaxID=585030 RepID=A0ABR2Z8Y7_9AGAR